MSTGAILAIVIPALVVLAVVVVASVGRRRDLDAGQGLLSRETRARDKGRDSGAPAAEVADEPVVSGKEIERAAALARRDGGELATVGAGAPVPWVPPDAEQIGVNRRQFFNRSIVGLMGFSLSGFGAACVAFLWPKLGGGFGSALTVGNVDELKAQIQAANGFLYYPEGRMWLTEYPAGAIKKAEAVYSDAELSGMRAGVLALYQKCPHLGCRVPECATSQWFECPCHGSQYNQAGEKKAGPAPRGMDRFAMSVSDNVLTVDTGAILQGPAIGIETTGQEAEGAHCIGQSTH